MPSSAEIEDARALGHQLADGGDQERRRCGDDGEEDRLESGHLGPSPADDADAVAHQRVGGENAESRMP